MLATAVANNANPTCAGWLKLCSIAVLPTAVATNPDPSPAGSGCSVSLQVVYALLKPTLGLNAALLSLHVLCLWLYASLAPNLVYAYCNAASKCSVDGIRKSDFYIEILYFDYKDCSCVINLSYTNAALCICAFGCEQNHLPSAQLSDWAKFDE